MTPLPDASVPFVLLCACACALLVLSEHRGWRAGIWVFKPLAASAFVATAIAAGALASSYGTWVLAGLCLCWLGDLLLIPKNSESTFLAGIASFLLGHVAYCVAFAGLGVAALPLAVGAAVALVLGLAALRWLRPHLGGVFVVAVPLYVLVIGSMGAISIAVVASGGPFGIAVGGWLFAVSDLFVARDRLVEHGFMNAAVGLPLYFGAQLVLATTVAAVSISPG